jgi:hypothetical protein
MSPKLQKIQQSPDLGFKIALHVLQRCKCRDVPLGIANSSEAPHCGQLILEDK